MASPTSIGHVEEPLEMFLSKYVGGMQVWLGAH